MRSKDLTGWRQRAGIRESVVRLRVYPPMPSHPDDEGNLRVALAGSIAPSGEGSTEGGQFRDEAFRVCDVQLNDPQIAITGMTTLDILL